jgi:hypothetical protein
MLFAEQKTIKLPYTPINSIGKTPKKAVSFYKLTLLLL